MRDKTEEGFERILEWVPAFDKRDPTPSKNYGIHGVEVRFVLIGPKGATQFILYTNWQLPHVREEFKKKYEGRQMGPRFLFEPLPADLGYHARERPDYFEESDFETFGNESCEFLDGDPCWYDGSTLNAERAFDALCGGGEEGVWTLLRREYAIRFPKPPITLSRYNIGVRECERDRRRYPRRRLYAVR